MKLNAPVFLLISVFLSFHLLSVAQEQEKKGKEEDKATAEHAFFVGIHSGPTYCTFYTNTFEILKQYTLTPRIGNITGIFLQLDITHRLAVNTELNYELATYTMTPDKILRNGYHPGPYYNPKLLRVEVSNYLIHIPLTLKYRITTGRTALFVNAGGYISTNFKSCTANVYEVTGNTYENEKKYNTWSSPPGIHYGAVAGFGLDRRMNKHLHFTLEIRDHFALNNLKNEETNALGGLVGLIYQLPTIKFPRSGTPSK